MMLLSSPDKLAVKTRSPSHASGGYELEGNLDLIGKLISVVTTIFLNIQGSGILNEKYFAGRIFAFFERKCRLSQP